MLYTDNTANVTRSDSGIGTGRNGKSWLSNAYFCVAWKSGLFCCLFPPNWILSGAEWDQRLSAEVVELQMVKVSRTIPYRQTRSKLSALKTLSSDLLRSLGALSRFLVQLNRILRMMFFASLFVIAINITGDSINQNIAGEIRAIAYGFVRPSLGHAPNSDAKAANFRKQRNSLRR